MSLQSLTNYTLRSGDGINEHSRQDLRKIVIGIGDERTIVFCYTDGTWERFERDHLAVHLVQKCPVCKIKHEHERHRLSLTYIIHGGCKMPDKKTGFLPKPPEPREAIQIQAPTKSGYVTVHPFCR